MINKAPLLLRTHNYLLIEKTRLSFPPSPPLFLSEGVSHYVAHANLKLTIPQPQFGITDMSHHIR